ncbi:MAG: zinc ribbon domain-containing protein [Thermoplasmatota archaeon]
MEKRMVIWGISMMLVLTGISITAFTNGREGSSGTYPQPAEDASGEMKELDMGEAPFSGALPLMDLGLDEAEFSPFTDAMVSDEGVTDEFIRYNAAYYALDPPTRASDAENEQNVHDFANGSKVVGDVETIDGTLTYDPDQVQSDWKDWYKLQVTDINELADTIDGVRNVSVELTSYTDGNDAYADLYELTMDSGALVNEFADFLAINLIYFDPWVGYVDMGNWDFMFDDQDDTDGWVWDGDNALYPDDNWSTPFRTPVNSEGEEDPDGFANGLTEVGWYYIGIGLDFYIRDQTWSRDLFTVKYSLKIDSSQQEDTDQGSNAFEDAQLYDDTSEPKHLNSRFNQVDWYKMEGSDPSKIWNISFTLDRQRGFGFISEDELDYMDNWIWTFIVWRSIGEDGIWNTDDDGWLYDYAILSFFITGGRFVSNAEQNLSFRYRSWALENEQREVYIGVIMEPVMVRIEGGEILGFYYYSPYTSWNNYTLSYSVVEEVPNRAPTLSELQIESDWPGHPTGGHYDSMFYFNITYTDPDNDPPKELNLVLDPLTMEEVVIDLKLHEVTTSDTDYTDGKDYSYSILGKYLTDDHYPHVVMVNATDVIPIGSIRIQRWSGDFYYNNTLYVWDDKPVSVNPTNLRMVDLAEDGGSEEVELESHNVNGVFHDPETDFLGFQAWNKTSKSWKTDYDSELIHIKIEKISGYWYAVVTPKANRNGEETVKFRGFDEHSNVTADIKFTVDPVNDLPKVFTVEVDGKLFDVDSTRPENPFVDLQGKVDVLQGEELIININAEDMDTEDEKQPLNYVFKESSSDDWEGPLEVNSETGQIKLTPNNDDIKERNSIIVVSIDDGSFDGVVTLRIELELTNINDEPSITLPDIDTVYERGDQISIVPIFNDPDPGDTLIISMNMLDDLEGVDPIVDQLPYADLEEDLDWSFNENIGRFWLKTNDWKIWKGTGGYVGVMNITVVLKVTDAKGAFDTVQIELKLVGGTIDPDEFDTLTLGEYHASVYDLHPETPDKVEGLKVNFKVDRIIKDIFGDDMEPRWEFDGEVISTKEDFDHTFDTYGLKTVYLYFEKDNMHTKAQKVELKFTLVEYIPPVTPDDDDVQGNASFGWVLPVLIIAIVVIVIILILAFFVISKRKKEQAAASEEYYDEQPHLHGGRGHAPGLGAHTHTRELSPAREAERTERLPPGRGDTAPKMECPHCGAAVQKGWFLCPECKNPLD